MNKISDELFLVAFGKEDVKKVDLLNKALECIGSSLTVRSTDMDNLKYHPYDALALTVTILPYFGRPKKRALAVFGLPFRSTTSLSSAMCASLSCCSFLSVPTSQVVMPSGSRGVRVQCSINGISMDKKVQGQAFFHEHIPFKITTSAKPWETKNLNAFLQIFYLLHLIKCPANAQLNTFPHVTCLKKSKRSHTSKGSLRFLSCNRSPNCTRNWYALQLLLLNVFLLPCFVHVVLFVFFLQHLLFGLLSPLLQFHKLLPPAVILWAGVLSQACLQKRTIQHVWMMHLQCVGRIIPSQYIISPLYHYLILLWDWLFLIVMGDMAWD